MLHAQSGSSSAGSEKYRSEEKHTWFTCCFEDSENSPQSPEKHKLYDSWRALKWIRGGKAHKVTYILATLCVLFITSAACHPFSLYSPPPPLALKGKFPPKYINTWPSRCFTSYFVFLVYSLLLTTTNTVTTAKDKSEISCNDFQLHRTCCILEPKL